VYQDVFTPNTLPPLPKGRIRYGVIGHPIAHSLSPFLHQAGFEALGRNAEYLRVEIRAENLSASIPRLVQEHFRGWNCTLPHKNSMFSLVDWLDSTALEAKSVNTVRVDGGKLEGFSTDALGWRAAIDETWNLDLGKSRILILGCGGVGQTLARHLAKNGCRSLVLTNRNVEKARELARELEPIIAGRFPLQFIASDAENVLPLARETDLFIQATSLGLRPDDPLPFDPHRFTKGTKIYDTVYRRERTALVRAAQKLGFQAEDGLGMLLHQGALSFTIWTGQKAPLEKMRQGLNRVAGRSS